MRCEERTGKFRVHHESLESVWCDYEVKPVATRRARLKSEVSFFAVRRMQAGLRVIEDYAQRLRWRRGSFSRT